MWTTAFYFILFYFLTLQYCIGFEMDNCFLTKVQKHFLMEKKVFSANGSETVDSLYVKELNFDPYNIQKVIQNESYTEG